MIISRASLVSLYLVGAASFAAAADVTGPVSFVGITPCRIIETRAGQGFSGQAGPPSLVANATRTFQITGTVPGVPAQCGIPSTAVAISVNFTVTNFAGQGDIRVFPAGGSLPNASILNYQVENIANATTVPLGSVGGGQRGISVRADAAATDLIVDVNGYYVPRPFVLESGQTLRGSYGIFTQAAGAGGNLLATITFQSPLATSPSAVAANFIAAGGASTATCPGSASNPQALAGNLCVYEGSQMNRNFDCIVRLSNGACGGADAFGAGVGFSSVAAGQAFSYGTWAVTAP